MQYRMDWRSVNFDWNRARAFLVTAEEGSLSAAARALNMTQPTLGRQVSALEEELGVTLFERVGRGLVLTQAGTQLLTHMRAMGEAAAAVSLVASGQQQDIAGHVAVTASEIYAGWLLPPIAARLAQIAPKVSLEVVASNAVRDLKRREADIAIRHARPEQPDLIGKLIAQDAAALFASPEYLAQLGPVETPADLRNARFIGLEDTGNLLDALTGAGFPITMQNFPVLTDSHSVHWDMARAGLGLCIGPKRKGATDPALRRVLPEFELPYPVWLVAHRELRTAPRIRLLWDLLADTLPGLITG
ncbi:LysR family transcriptional regulator [Tropicibacter naphthalenivorans]|uniref:HTH-type transcriptional regulator TfdS n=1 Tax=Tropicibacter naphthalenivorans TaxID=441103 RepID=A0A0P1GDI4_9RHOB|nr:LysR family transcriptional regulator [Tropicibacter naphthalenivorans]CUH79350.1 HTH-type transcriptional regulator TfdS [Tropicibacter naphthalenivorans]SMC71504.1 transcriptional regulator, LysR family [Tropicibacter naphthalenivorans]